MPDLNFQVVEVKPERYSAEPVLRFRLRVAEDVADGAAPTPIHSVALRCQLRIVPSRRRYADAEKAKLVDLFGTAERWGQTLLPMLWTHASVVVPPFVGSRLVELPVPCSFDFSLAATKYFDALEGGEIPLCLLFSGTIFYEGAGGALQVEQISWEKEATCLLPAATWRGLMDLHYPNIAWIGLRKDVFDRLSLYKSRQNLPTWERAMERLLSAAEEPAAP